MALRHAKRDLNVYANNQGSGKTAKIGTRKIQAQENLGQTARDVGPADD